MFLREEWFITDITTGIVSGVVVSVIGPISFLLTQKIWNLTTGYFKRNREILAYLKRAFIFLDGLELFFEKTYNWGPSIPNYGVEVPTHEITDLNNTQLDKTVRKLISKYMDNSSQSVRGRVFKHRQEIHEWIKSAKVELEYETKKFLANYSFCLSDFYIWKLRKFHISEEVRSRLENFDKNKDVS